LMFIFQSYVLGLFTIEDGAMTRAVRLCGLFMESQALSWGGERYGTGARFSDYLWLISANYHPSIFH
jgi:hypothetical protein